MKEPVFLVPYNADWPTQFQDEKRRLLTLFTEIKVLVEHMGSTAVPGLASKQEHAGRDEHANFRCSSTHTIKVCPRDHCW